MFAVSKRFRLTNDPDLPLILNEYQTLHFDEVPILFTGVNKYGSRVLGSSVEDSARAKVSRFFYIVVSTEQYLGFLRRKLSYRDIIVGRGSVFVVDQSFSGELKSTYLVNLAHVPAQYIPLENSYCPVEHFRPSLTFGTVLKGKLADLHEADSADLRVVDECFPGIVQDALGSLGQARLTSRSTVQPYLSGSFRIQFNVVPSGQLPLVPGGMDAYKSYAALYLDFCLNHFQDEFSAAIAEGRNDAPFFQNLLGAYCTLVGSSDATVASELMASARKSVDRLNDLSTIVGGNFSSVELFNVHDGSETLVGTFDKYMAAELSQSTDRYDALVGGGVVEDESPLDYSILIYNLNTETRRGQAYIAAGDSLTRVRFIIKGSDPLEQTIFTSSLDKSIKIKVAAQATRVAGKLKSLKISFQGNQGAGPAMPQSQPLPG